MAAGSLTAILQVFLLGPPMVKWDGQPVAIARRQVRALLYRLAAEPEPIPREQLCFLFWPNMPEAMARRKLTGLLAHLRRTLPTSDALITRGDHVGLDPDHAWSDLRAFQSLSTVRGLEVQPEGLRRAVESYRGALLDGFSLPESPEFEMWIAQERQSCERLYLEALTVLIEGAAAVGDYGRAIDYARRYLATDELAEEIHRRLMGLYAASGDRSAALLQFEQCAMILERELGVEPLPETRAAYRLLLEGRPAPQVVPVAVPTWRTLPGLDVALVGRNGTLEQLEKAFVRARSGQGGVILISGEPGIGKSRLVKDFARQAGERALVLAGAGYRDAQTNPYQPIVEALRPAVLAHHASLGVASCCLAETSRLLPELRMLYPDLPAPMTGESRQARSGLFEALGRIALGLAASQGPVLLCLDDLHWADETTLAWLAHLGRQLQGSRLLVIGTYRGGKASTLAELRRGLAREGVLSELALGGLDEAAVLELLQPLGEALPLDQGVARRLRRLTGGNPFFLLEIARALIEAGHGPEELESPIDFALPDSVQDAVQARVTRLSAGARQVLEASAVLGRAFDLELVQRTSGRQELEAMDGLDELVERQLLEERGDGYRFRHELIQVVVYGKLSRWRRRALHRRAGESLERSEPGDMAGLAWHFERAAEPGRAARYSLQAGREAKEVFAHVEAQAHFDRALALWAQEAAELKDPEALATNHRMRIDAYYERGWALRLVGDMEAYARDLEEVARLAWPLDDPQTLAHLQWRMAYIHRWFCRFEWAREAAEDGVRLSLKAADPLLEAMCRREVGLAARARGDYEQARAMLERALGLFVELGDTVYEIHALGNLATLCWYEGGHEEVLHLSQRALARCEEADLPLERRLPLGDMGAAAVALGEAELARDCLEESLYIARETSDRTQEILCRTHLGWLAVRLERPEEAVEHLQAGLELAERIGSCTEQSWLLSGLAQADLLAGEEEQARDHARRALELAQRSGAVYDQKLARRILSRLGGE